MSPKLCLRSLLGPTARARPRSSPEGHLLEAVEEGQPAVGCLRFGVTWGGPCEITIARKVLETSIWPPGGVFLYRGT